MSSPFPTWKEDWNVRKTVTKQCALVEMKRKIGFQFELRTNSALPKYLFMIGARVRESLHVKIWPSLWTAMRNVSKLGIRSIGNIHKISDLFRSPLIRNHMIEVKIRTRLCELTSTDDPSFDRRIGAKRCCRIITWWFNRRKKRLMRSYFYFADFFLFSHLRLERKKTAKAKESWAKIHEEKNRNLLNVPILNVNSIWTRKIFWLLEWVLARLTQSGQDTVTKHMAEMNGRVDGARRCYCSQGFPHSTSFYSSHSWD